MRLISVTLCAVTVAAATLFPATVAMAGDEPGTVSVNPSVIAPGEDVDLRVHCGGGEITGTSVVFAAKVVFAPAADKGAMYAEARIKADVAAAEYPVEVWCKGRKSTGMITVARHGGRATPTAPVHAGGGGTALVAADQDGAATRNALVGLVLAGVAAVTVTVRSFRRRRDSE